MTARRNRVLRGLSASACVFLFGFGLRFSPAVAQSVASQDHPFSLRLGSTMNWDSNVLRVPDSVTDPQSSQGKSGRSDRVSITSVGLRFDKAFSLQRVFFDINEIATRYDKFTSLNRDSFNYVGTWFWQLSPRISGTFSADHTESVIGFEDLVLGQRRSETTTENRAATVDALLTGGWHLLAGAYQTDRKNSVVFLAMPNLVQTSEEIGLRYVAASQNSIAFIARTRQGTIRDQAVDTAVFFLANSFTVQEREVNATWVASGKSALIGRLTAVDYRYEHVPQRDFSGTAGEIRYTWAPSGKLAIVVSALRNVLPWTPDTSTSYRVEETLTFAPTWRISEKSNLRFVAYRLATDYLGAVVPTLAPARRDVLRSVQVGADWLPYRAVTLTATLRRDTRSSNEPTAPFDATIVGVNASLRF